jgi:hypothetical protein
MRKIVTSIYRKLISKDTWNKVWYFNSAKNPRELKRKITKDDIFPIILSIIVYAGAVLLAMHFFKAMGGCIERLIRK